MTRLANLAKDDHIRDPSVETQQYFYRRIALLLHERTFQPGYDPMTEPTKPPPQKWGPMLSDMATKAQITRVMAKLDQIDESLDRVLSTQDMHATVHQLLAEVEKLKRQDVLLATVRQLVADIEYLKRQDTLAETVRQLVADVADLKQKVDGTNNHEHSFVRTDSTLTLTGHEDPHA